MSEMERKRSRRSNPMPRRQLTWTLLVLLLLLHLCQTSQAQVFGTTVCVCSSSNYRMTLDFSQTCDETSITGDGVITTDCAIAPFQDDTVTDLVPVTVGSIDILELDEELVLLTQSSKFGTFGDGDSFEYTSISNDASMVNATVYPKALQVSILGNNAAGDSLFFAGLLIFKTDCSTYPVLDVGDSIGWITFTELTDPKSSICPIVETRPPSATPPPVPAPAPTPSGVSPLVSGASGDPPSIPSRSTRAPAPTTPKPRPPSCDSSSSYSKSSKSSKGKGKSSKKGVRGKGKGKKAKDYYYYDIFDRDACDSSKGKGKGKGKSKKGGSKSSKGKGQYTHPTHPPVSRGSGDGIPTSAPTGSTASLDQSSSVDQSSIDQPEQFFDGQRRFWGSSAYYSFLLVATAAALVGAVYAWKRPQQQSEADRERLIALQKGLQWSERQ